MSGGNTTSSCGTTASSCTAPAATTCAKCATCTAPPSSTPRRPSNRRREPPAFPKEGNPDARPAFLADPERQEGDDPARGIGPQIQSDPVQHRARRLVQIGVSQDQSEPPHAGPRR